MKYEELQDKLKREILPAYMINGGESYLTVSALKMIEKALCISLPDFNIMRVSDDYNSGMTKIVEHCEALPLIDNKRLIIVDDFLGKKNEAEKKVITKYLSKPCNSTCIVFFSTTPSDFFSSFQDKVENIDCKAVSQGYLLNFLSEKLAKYNLSSSRETKQMICDYCNNSITKIDTQIDKLFFVKGEGGEITKEDVENFIERDLEYVIFDLTNAICNKDKERAILIVNDMIKNKEQPATIVSIITNHFRRLFFISRSVLSSQELASLLNVKEYAISKYRAQLKYFSQKELKRIYDLCIECDLNIKSGKLEGKTAVMFLIFSILK